MLFSNHSVKRIGWTFRPPGKNHVLALGEIVESVGFYGCRRCFGLFVSGFPVPLPAESERVVSEGNLFAPNECHGVL